MADLLDIVGQGAAIGQLSRIVASGRRPIAYLFAGPMGVGRRTTAEALANTLLCRQTVSRQPQGRLAEFPEELTVPGVCGQCPDCLALAAGTHADYHAVSRQTARYSQDPEVRSRVMQNLSVQVVREFIISPAGRRSARGRGKVFVVRQAEQMSDVAQNALLKTLEEPPPGVSLILICRSPDDLLATTRSRCALVRFGALPADFVIDRLIAVGVDPDQARFWASYTDRSVGRALRLANGAGAGWVFVVADDKEHALSLDAKGAVVAQRAVKTAPAAGVAVSPHTGAVVPTRGAPGAETRTH